MGKKGGDSGEKPKKSKSKEKKSEKEGKSKEDKDPKRTKSKGDKDPKRTKSKDDKETKRTKSKSKDDKEPKRSKSKDKKGKDKKKKGRGKSKDKMAQDGGRGSKGDLGFEVKLDPYAPYPTEEDLKRFGPLSVEAKQAHTAIVLLDSEEKHVIIESLNSLQRFCIKRNENREIFVVLNGVSKIWKFFHDEDTIIQRLALKILAIISSLQKVRVLCRDYKFAEEIGKLGQSEDQVVLEYFTGIVCNLATLFTGRIQLIRNGAVPFLVTMLGHYDADIQRNAIDGLLNILEEPLHVHLFLNPETVQMVYNLIESEHPEIQSSALSVLERLSRYPPEGVQLVQNTGIIHSMGSKLSDPTFGDLHRIYLKILVNVTQDVSNCKKLAPLLGQLVTLLDHSRDVQVLHRTLLLLGRMARIPLITQALVGLYEIVPKLVFIVSKYANIELRSVATYTSAQIAATDYKAKAELTEIFKPMKALFFDVRASSACFENVLMATTVLLEHGDESQAKFLSSGGLSILYNVCATDPKDTKFSYHTSISALTCVAMLGHREDFRKAMIDQHLLPAVLLQMTSWSAQVVTLAATALAPLLCSQEGRNQFLEHGGYNYIATAAKNPDLNVVIGIIPLISGIATYTDIASHMVNNGLLNILWERQDLLGINGPLRVALDRLISSHLPAKYAYKGHIGPYEKLTHEFYDAGILQTDKVFTPLESIKFEDRANHKKIIYVNFDDVCSPNLVEENPILRSLGSPGVVSIIQIANEVRDMIPDNVRTEKDLVGLLATVVCARLGGQLDKWRVSVEAEEMELANFQSKHKSVVVPLTCMTTGAHRPRALMFKALADIFGIPCSLDRGGFRKCWNVVLIRAKRAHAVCPCAETPEEEQGLFFTERLRRFVVDLLYAPGTLFPLYSYEADTYCFC